jgi:hypothetical protein
MQHRLIQSVGVAWTILYAVFIVWIYATEPRTLKEVASSAQVAAGTYEINREKFEEGLRLFRSEQFRAARDEWGRADPQQRDARTQFYIAYAFYREGWGRVYNDDALFKQGLDSVIRRQLSAWLDYDRRSRLLQLTALTSSHPGLDPGSACPLRHIRKAGPGSRPG